MNRVIFRFLLIVFFLMAVISVALGASPSPMAAHIPAQVQNQIDKMYADYTLESYQMIYGTPDGDHLFTLIRSETERRLLCFRYQKHVWDLWLDVKNAVPQTDLPAYLSYRPQGKMYRIDVGSEKYNQTYVSDGVNLLLIVVNGETYEETAYYQWRDGGYYLTEYSKRTQCFVNILGDEWVFSNLGSGFDGDAVYPLDTDILSVNFDQLPAALCELPVLYNGVPVIACEVHGLPHSTLSLQNVTFPKGKKYEVYQGPGKKFGRSAQGKAVVSTNDWIQVFGEYEGWLLIQYGVGEGKFRIGWITHAALPKGITVAPLNFAAGSKSWLDGQDGSYPLTDDPLGSQAPIVTIKGEPEVEMLARLGVDWVYVRVKYKGNTYYGFVPAAWTRGNG